MQVCVDDLRAPAAAVAEPAATARHIVSATDCKKGLEMMAQTPAPLPAAQPLTHELRFASLFHPGRGVVVPCSESGRVDLDRLTERLRLAYLGARAMVGREYAYPTVQRAH